MRPLRNKWTPARVKPLRQQYLDAKMSGVNAYGEPLWAAMVRSCVEMGWKSPHPKKLFGQNWRKVANEAQAVFTWWPDHKIHRV